MTDLTPTDDGADVEVLARAVTAGDLPIDVHVTGGLGLPDDAACGLRRGPASLLSATTASPTSTT